MAKVEPVGGPVWAPKGSKKLHTCASGRQVEYAVLGRCNDDDPWLLHLMGMYMNNLGFGPIELLLGASRVPALKTLDDLPFKVICPARAGYGRSTPPPDPHTWTYKDMAADMRDLCAALGAERVALVGVSSGGTNCFAFASHFPDMASAVLSISGDANYGPSAPTTKVSLPSSTPYKEDDPKYGVGMAMCRDGCCAICCHGACRCNCCCPVGVVADYSIESRDPDFKFEDVKCPVVLVHGVKDDCVDVNCAHYIAQKVPQAEKLILDKMGHGQVPAETFDQVMAKLKDLADGAPAQSQMQGDA